jgi:serine/threonine protein kinase
MLFCKACKNMVDPPEEGPTPSICPVCNGGLTAIPQHSKAEGDPAQRAKIGDPKNTATIRLETFHKYRIIEKLGSGGMGVVYRARDPLLKREVALKIFRPNLFEDPSYLVRFRHEAEVAARLHHPNIAPLYEFGIYDQCPYYTMELIQGESLSAVIQRMGRLPTRAALLVGRDCAIALHYAHAQGVIHRDIKSANILIRQRPSGQGTPESARDSRIELASGVISDFQAVLLDFGLARINTADQAVTQAGDLVGTPSYMSPEQVSGRLGVVTAKSDIFALGVVLYEALTGQLPFVGEELHVMLSRIESEDPIPPRKQVPTLHRDVDAIVLKALEKNPDRRYATSEAFAADIDRYLRGEVTEARPASPIARAWRKIRKHKHLILPPAVSLIVTLIIFGYVTVYVPLRRKAEAREIEIRLLETTLQHKRDLEAQGRTGRIEAEKRLERGDLEGTIALCRELEAKLGGRFGERPEVPKVEHVDWANDPRFKELMDAYRLPIPDLHLLRAEALEALDRPREALMAHSLSYATSRSTGDAAGRRALLAIGKLLEAAGREPEALSAYRLHYRTYDGTLQSDEAAYFAGMLSLKLGDPGVALTWLERARLKGRLPAGQNSAAERTISLLKEWVPEHVATIHGRWLGAGDVDGDGTDELLALDVRGRLRILHMEDEGWTPGHEQQLLPIAVARAMDEDDQPVRLAVANLDGVGRPELIVATRHRSVRSTGISVFAWRDKEYQSVAQLRLGPRDEVLGFVAVRLAGGSELHLAIPSRALTGGLRLLKLTAQGLVEDSFVNLYAPPSLVAAADIDAKPGDELIVAVAGESPGLVLLRQSSRGLQISDRFGRPCRASGLSVAHTDLILTCEEIGRGQKEALEGGLWSIRLDGAAFGEPVRLLPLDRTGTQTLLLGAHGLRGRREIVLAEIGDRNELFYRVLSSAAWGETDIRFRTGSREPPPAGWIPFFRSSRHGPSEPLAAARATLALASHSPTGWRISALGSGIRGSRPPADPDTAQRPDPSDPLSRRLKVIDEINSLGLHEAALELCERAGRESASPEALAAVAMKRGRCLQDMGRSSESSAAYQEAAGRSPLLAVDALTAIAASRADRGDWEGVRQALKTVLNQHTPGGFRGARIESEVQEASDILSQQPRLLVGRDLRDGLLSESPHHLTFMAEGSKIGVRGTNGFHAYRHAFPFRYDGSTMSVATSLKIVRADPGTRLSLELGTLSTYPMGDPREPGYIRVGFELTFGPIPTLRAYAVFSDGDIELVERDLPPELTTRVCSIDIQILGVSRAVVVSIDNLRIRVPLPRDLPRGNYAIMIGAGGREEGWEGTLQAELDQLTLNSAGRELRPARSDASTPEERILAAGGQIAAGNLAGCLRQLQPLLSAAPVPPASSAAHELLSDLRVPLSPRQTAFLYKGLVGPSTDSGDATDDLRTVLSEEPVRALAWLRERVDGMDDAQRGAARKAIARHASADWVRRLGASLESTRGFEPARANTIRRELEEHLRQTSVQHALLWAIHYALDPGGSFADFAGQGMDLRFRRACRVSEVRSDSQAAAAGLLPGDVLLACDGTPVESESDFARALADAPRTTATIRLLRRGRGFDVEMRRDATGVILTQTWAAVSSR